MNEYISLSLLCGDMMTLQVEEVVDPFPKDVFHKARLATDNMYAKQKREFSCGDATAGRGGGRPLSKDVFLGGVNMENLNF